MRTAAIPAPWLSIGSLGVAPSDILDGKTKQSMVKDEVSFKRPISPIDQMLRARQEMLSKPESDIKPFDLRNQPERR